MNKSYEGNKRGNGGVNKIRIYPCGICGQVFTSYPSQKKHLSRAHGKSTKGYDRMLENELGAR